MATDRASERRLITAVFVDVVGSTELTSRLGPERMRRHLNDAFAEIKTLAIAEGGTVEKYIGDAVFILFGAPVAHADDPRRALRLGESCVRWFAGGSSPLAVRVGIETGEALVDLDAVGEHQRMAIGDCVNTAARLQQHADPGEVLVGPTCRNASAESAVFADMDLVKLKGVGEIRPSRLVALREERAPFAPFIGRARELDRLRELFTQALSGRATLVLVSGEPGIGKTRLIDEFIREVGSSARVLEARCRPGTEVGVDTPLRQLVGSLDETRLPTAVAHSVGLVDDARLLSLGLPDRRTEIEVGWRGLLETLAAERPLVIRIEDVQWAEPETVRVLDRASSRSAARLMVVATARPDFPGITALRPGEDRAFIELEPLDDRSATELVRSFETSDLETVRRAEGNPLFLVELARARAARGAEVPLTLQGAISARLDEIDQTERDLLQRASVAGERFTVRDAAILSERSPAEVAGMLGRLAHQGYVIAVDGGFRFHHGLVREAAYGRLPSETRMKLHARFAREAIEPDDMEALAHHWWAALAPPDADWVWEDETERAALRREGRRVHIAAGRRLADRLATERMVTVLERARELSADDLEKAEVEAELGRACARNARGEDATAHRLRAIELHRASGHPVPPGLFADTIDIPAFNWGYFRKLPSVEEVVGLIDEGIAAARAQHDDVALLRLLVQRATFMDDASLGEEIEGLLARITDLSRYADVLWRVGVMHAVIRRDIGRALRAVDLALMLGAQGASLNEPEALVWRSLFRVHAGDLAGARADAERLDRVSEAKGPHTRQHALGVSGYVSFLQGDWSAVGRPTKELRVLVAANPEASFCIFGLNLASFGAIADVLEGRDVPSDLVGLAERLVPEAASTRAAALLPPFVMAGKPVDDAEAEKSYGSGRRIFDRQVVLDLTAMNMILGDGMRGNWRTAGRWLPRLDELSSKGSGFAAALAEAVREETAHADGGPKPAHRKLRDLGFAGVSELLAYRRAVTPPVR